MKPEPTRQAGRDGEGGFALIEAIAVMLLSGLVMLTLLIATDLVTRNARAATQRANAIEGLATGLAALRRDLAAASFTRGGTAPDAPVLFEGGPRSLSLARTAQGSEPEKGQGAASSGALVRIESRYEQGRGLLVRTEAPLGLMNTGFAGAAFGSPVVLLTGPWTYRLSYGAATAGKMSWQENWTSSKALPDVVRLEILDAGSGQPIVTPLLAALRVNAELKCTPDESGACSGEGDSDRQDGAAENNPEDPPPEDGGQDGADPQ
jgi:type II secretory pathway pseudopilin PulG